jgi:hypothetical protein
MGEEAAEGQSIKTRIVTQEIEKSIGGQQVRKIDTCGWKKHPFKMLFNCIKAVYDSENVVFLTASGGVKVFPLLLTCANILTKRTIHYVVIGGWLVRLVENHRFLIRILKRLDGIFVETRVMQKGLQGLGIENVYLMPNFKELTLVSENELSDSVSEPYRFCIFSRVKE